MSRATANDLPDCRIEAQYQIFKIVKYGHNKESIWRLCLSTIPRHARRLRSYQVIAMTDAIGKSLQWWLTLIIRIASRRANGTSSGLAGRRGESRLNGPRLNRCPFWFVVDCPPHSLQLLSRVLSRYLRHSVFFTSACQCQSGGRWCWSCHLRLCPISLKSTRSRYK